jgi:hypothetical protein
MANSTWSNSPPPNISTDLGNAASLDYSGCIQYNQQTYTCQTKVGWLLQICLRFFNINRWLLQASHLQSVGFFKSGVYNVDYFKLSNVGSGFHCLRSFSCHLQSVGFFKLASTICWPLQTCHLQLFATSNLSSTICWLLSNWHLQFVGYLSLKSSTICWPLQKLVIYDPPT